jgi:integrase
MARVYRRVRNPEGRLVDRSDAGPGAWYLDYRDGSGRHVREATAATTKGEALQLLRKRQSDAARAEIAGVPNPEGLRVTFKAFVDDTFLPHVKATRRKGTFECYERYAAVTCAVLGSKLLRSIGKADVLNYTAERVRTGHDGRAGKGGASLAPATINREFAFIRAALYDAMSRELIDRNPCARVKLLAEENERTRVMTEREEVKLLEKAEPWIRPMLRVAVLAGLRRGEILNLKWADIREGLIHVSPESKSHEGRAVPITPDLVPILDAIDHMVTEGRAVEWVFPDPVAGGQIKEHVFAWEFVRAAKAAELRDLHFHDLRRTFASRLAKRGVSLQTIADLLGHSSVYVTTRYSWLAPDTLKEAVDKLSQPAAHTNRTHEPALKAGNE